MTADTPVFDWNTTENTEDDQDFLEGVEGQEAPTACSLEAGQCEACQ